MRISDWSSDVCSSDLGGAPDAGPLAHGGEGRHADPAGRTHAALAQRLYALGRPVRVLMGGDRPGKLYRPLDPGGGGFAAKGRSEEHTSELQSLMRISYAVFCLKKKNKQQNRTRAK